MANRTRTFLGTLAGVAILAWASIAHADDALPDVSRMVRELRYEDALARIEQIRRAPDSSPVVKLRALELAALAQLGLGHEADAREAFVRLLTLDPGAELTEQRPSPRLVELFQSVRQSLGREEPRAGLLTSVEAPALEGASLTATARPDGEHAIVRVVFRARVGGTESDIQASRSGSSWSAGIPVPSGADLRRATVIARGFAPSGRLSAVSPPAHPDVGGTGGEGEGEDDPFQIGETPTDESGRGGLTSKWWFWGGIGAVVVGGTITAIVLASSGGQDARQGDLGSLQLSPVAGE